MVVTSSALYATTQACLNPPLTDHATTPTVEVNQKALCCILQVWWPSSVWRD